MGLGKVQVMKNKSVVVGKGEKGKGGDYSCNTGQGLFAQADNFLYFFQCLCPQHVFSPSFLSWPKSLPILIQFVSLHLCCSSEKFQKADLTLLATPPKGPSISCWPQTDSGRGKKRADKELEGMMEVDGKEFCGSGGQSTTASG